MLKLWFLLRKRLMALVYPLSHTALCHWRLVYVQRKAQFNVLGLFMVQEHLLEPLAGPHVSHMLVALV